MQAKLLKPRMSRRVLLSMSPQDAVNLKYLTMYAGTTGDALSEADEALSTDRVTEFLDALHHALAASLTGRDLPRCDLLTDDEDAEEVFEGIEVPDVPEVVDAPADEVVFGGINPHLVEADVFPNPPRVIPEDE